MVRFFNQDEMGIEGVAGAVTSGAQKAVKATSDQAGATSQDIANQLYGVLDKGQDPSEDQGSEAAGQGKATAAMKAQTNIRNPAAQQAIQRRAQLLKTKAPEDVDKLEKLRKLLHDEQVRDILEPKKQQPEERIADKIAREEEEKKKKKQEQQYIEEKKKEDLSVVQKRTSIENKGVGAG